MLLSSGSACEHIRVQRTRGAEKNRLNMDADMAFCIKLRSPINTKKNIKQSTSGIKYLRECYLNFLGASPKGIQS